MHIICFTNNGFNLANSLLQKLRDENASVNFCSKSAPGGTVSIPLDEWVKLNFKKGNVLVFIGACGIAVRAIAPYIQRKDEDAAVIVMDEKGQFVVPLLSGHLGGANEYAQKIAHGIGAVAVMTTATDVHNLFAVDVFAKENGFAIEDLAQIKAFSSALLQENHGFILVDDCLHGKRFELCTKKNIPPEIKVVHSQKDVSGSKAVCLVSASEKPEYKDFAIHLIPRVLVLGIGCKKGKPYSALKAFAENVLREHNLSMSAVFAISSIDIKKNEGGIISLAESLSVPFKTFTAQELMAVKQKCSSSEFVRQVTGVDNVCERAAYATGCNSLIVQKTAFDGMTLCVGFLELIHNSTGI